MLRYHAITPTYRKYGKDGEMLAQFKGRTCGVQFSDGEAYFDLVSLAKNLGKTPEEVAVQMVADFGYTVTVIDEDGTERPFDPAELVRVPVAEPAPKRKKA